MVVLLIFLIVAIAAFNVISMLMMSVMNKRKDIAVLQTLGLSRGDIVGVFLVQGSMIGVVGIALGVLLGVLGCYFVPILLVGLKRHWVRLFSIPRYIRLTTFPLICVGPMCL